MNLFSKNISVAEQAAFWVTELDDPTETPSLSAFSQWLKASPQNVEEFLLTAAAWGWFDRVDPRRELEVRKMIEDAKANVVTLQAEKTTPPRRRRFVLAAAVGAIALVAALVFALSASGSKTFTTDTGEQRTVQLADGSVVYLNTQSKLDVRYSPQGRDIRLLAGEALFIVEKDPARPFRVTAGETVIQALGTQFNVYRQPNGTKVSVIEGAVQVLDKKLVAGEEAKVVAGGAIAKQTMTDVTAAVAWRERRLVFRDDTLADIVVQFNRYNTGYQLELADDASGQLRLTGVFRADDPQAMLLFLDANSDLQVNRGADGAKIGRQN